MPTVKATTEPVNRAVHEIQERIRTGQYVPGQRLIEPDLVNELGVKRGSVREALRILAGDGVITLVAQKGAHVRKLDSVELVEIIQLITGLLNLSIELALQQPLRKKLRDELNAIMVGMQRVAKVGAIDRFHMEAARYHQLLRESANNKLLLHMYDKLHTDLLLKQLRAGSVVTDWKKYLVHFEKLHEALLAGKVNVARRLVNAHGRELIDMTQREAGPGAW